MSAELYLVRHAEAAGHEDVDPACRNGGGHRPEPSPSDWRRSGRPRSCTDPGAARPRPRTSSQALPDAPVESTPLLEDRTPVPSAGRRGEYPERFWSWLDGVPADERDVDGAALTAALPGLAGLAEDRADDGPLVLVTHAFVVGWFVRELLDAPT